jgi:hypothetical protein
MRRLLTLGLVLALAAIATVAVADALRGSNEVRAQTEGETLKAETVTSSRKPAPVPPLETNAAGLAERLRRSGIGGTLFLSADGCLDGTARHLRAVRLPDLELTEGPLARSCAFTVSAHGEAAAGQDAVWSPARPVFAAETGPGELQVIDVERERRREIAGARPSFGRDGSLAFLRAGDVCGEVEISVRPSTCSRVVVSRHELVRALPRDRKLESVEALVWPRPSRLLAILRTAEGTWLAPYEDGRALGYANGLTSQTTARPVADPTAAYVALGSGGFLEVYDLDGGRVWLSSIRPVAFAWSPDGEWLAYAEPRNVYFLRTDDWTTRFSLTVSTRGLAWR